MYKITIPKLGAKIKGLGQTKTRGAGAQVKCLSITSFSANNSDPLREGK